jgi:hypothetical protein
VPRPAAVFNHEAEKHRGTNPRHDTTRANDSDEKKKKKRWRTGSAGAPEIGSEGVERGAAERNARRNAGGVKRRDSGENGGEQGNDGLADRLERREHLLAVARRGLPRLNLLGLAVFGKVGRPPPVAAQAKRTTTKKKGGRCACSTTSSDGEPRKRNH